VTAVADQDLESFVRSLPKAELHVHIEGTLEPELMLELGARNRVSLPFETVEDAKSAYAFTDLQSFLQIYYTSTAVLQSERDFYDLTRAYLDRAVGERLRHVEVFFDPQAHTRRGVRFEAVVSGIHEALVKCARDYGLTSRLILCFLRDLSAEEAARTLKDALPYRDQIVAVGLDSNELGHPPSKFREVFDHARDCGFATVAHAGEEGPPEYIDEAIDQLAVSRIDHGVRCSEDPALMRRLAELRIPLTVCPLSNLRLGVFGSIEEHNLRELLESGLCVTLNSDDPAYFGGYVCDNYLAAARGLSLSRSQITTLVRNSFEASFLGEAERRLLLGELDRHLEACGS
jgi:adenosine deaminase